MTAPVTSATVPNVSRSFTPREGVVLDNLPLLDEPTHTQFDSIGALYQLLAEDARLDSNSTMQEIGQANRERQEAWQQRLDALQEARKAQEDEGFWSSFASTFGTVAKIAAVVGSVALAVGTLGAGAPVVALAVAGAVLSSASLAQDEFHYLESLGFSESTAGWINLGLGVGGALCSISAAGIGLFSNVETLAEAGSSLASTGRTLGYGAGVVSGVSGASAGVGVYYAGQATHEVRHHEATAAQALLDAQLLQLLLTQLLEDLEDTKQRETNNIERITTMNGLESATLLAAAGGTV